MSNRGEAGSLRAVPPATAGELFRLIREGAATTRPELGRATGLSRTAIAARVEALLGLRVFRETEEGGPDAGSGVGRPPARLSFEAAAGVVLAAAVGRSRTQVAVCDLAGTVLAARDVQQEIGLGPDDLMPRVVGALAETLGLAGRSAKDVRG